MLQGRIAPDKFKHLFQDVEDFFLDLIKYPLVQFTGRKNAGVFQIDQMARSFGLRKFKDAFQVGDAHFSVAHDKIENTQTGGVGTSHENL